MKLPSAVCSFAAGCYLESERRVLILVYSEFRKFKTWFGVPIDRTLYRSSLSHEVAHLVADFNFKILKPSIQAKEYIAYITQLSIMEPVLREARAFAISRVSLRRRLADENDHLYVRLHEFRCTCFTCIS